MVQWQALLAMTGALRSTATDILEAHTNDLPFDLFVDRLCHRAAVRLCTLPTLHLLAAHVQQAGKCFVRAHHSALHELLDAYRPFLDISHTECIKPAQVHPQWCPRHKVHVIPNREAAAVDDRHWNRHGAYQVYTDRSDIDGGVGTVAILYPPGRRRPRYLYMHLGPSTRHTMYEAGIAATILGLKLLCTERHAVGKASIALDNMAAVQASMLRLSVPGCYLTDMFHRQLERLKKARLELRLTLRWAPGHDDLPGNEAVDAVAKEAVGGRCSPTLQLPKPLRSPLPMNTS